MSCTTIKTSLAGNYEQLTVAQIQAMDPTEVKLCATDFGADPDWTDAQLTELITHLSHVSIIDAYHKKTDPKVFVVVIPKEGYNRLHTIWLWAGNSPPQIINQCQ